MSYNDDKRELLKLKQGLIPEEESGIASAEKTAFEKPKGMAAVKNFFYHNKMYIIAAVFFAIVGVYLVYSFVTRKKEDIKILSIATSYEGLAELSGEYSGKVKEIREAFEAYTPDFDNNGYVYVANYFIDLNEDGVMPDIAYANRTKLLAEAQEGTARIIIGDEGAFALFADEIDPGDFFVDLENRYPGNPNVVDKYYFRVKDAEFGEKAGIEEDVLFIAVRANVKCSKNTAENTRRALEVMDGITGQP